MSSGEEFPLHSYVTYTCDLSHQNWRFDPFSNPAEFV